MHLTGAIFIVGAFGLAGLPPLGTWLGKSLLEDTAMTSGATWLVPIVIGASVLTGGAVLRVALRVFFACGPRPADADEAQHQESPETRDPMRRAALPMLIPALVLVAAALAVGLVPALRSGTAAAAAAFVDTNGYVTAVLSNSHAETVSPRTTSPALTLPSIGFGLLCAVLAIAVAAAALWGSRLPRFVHSVARPGRSCMTLLHRIHAPHVGDQVAWLLVGVAALIIVLL